MADDLRCCICNALSYVTRDNRQWCHDHRRAELPEVLAERKRCAEIARAFGEDQGNWGAEAYDAGGAIAEEIERG